MFMMKSGVIGRPSVVSDDLVRSVDQKICERRRFTISEFSCEFPQISYTLLYETITVRLGCHKFCARWFRKSLRLVQNTENGFGFDFLERYHKDGDEFLNHIVRLTGDET
jgi:hypothetical protein